MNLKNFLMLACASVFAVAGMTSCSSSNDDFIDEDGEIIAPAIAHKCFGLSVNELKTQMAKANYTLISSGGDTYIFNNNGVEPSKVAFRYEDGKMFAAEASVSVNANNMMNHFKKWDAVMWSKKSELPTFSACNREQAKNYTNHDEFVADMNNKTKFAIESLTSNTMEATLFISDHEITYIYMSLV